MKKKNTKGFMLIETLIVTVFVAGVLIFMFIQLTILMNNNMFYLYVLFLIINYILRI